jgi:hypothetical protein
MKRQEFGRESGKSNYSLATSLRPFSNYLLIAFIADESDENDEMLERTTSAPSGILRNGISK